MFLVPAVSPPIIINTESISVGEKHQCEFHRNIKELWYQYEN